MLRRMSKASERLIPNGNVSTGGTTRSNRIYPSFYFYSGGVRVGRVSLKFKQDGVTEVWSFIIDDEFRGAGFGKAMMRDIIKLCRRLGVKSLWLNCYRANRAAVACYKANGFTLKSTGFSMMEGTLVLNS